MEETPPEAPAAVVPSGARLPVENRDEILDLATTLALCGDDTPYATVRATKYPSIIGEFHRTSIHRSGQAQRQRDRAYLENIDRDLAQRQALLGSLAEDVKRQALLESERRACKSKIDELLLDLRTARERAQREQLDGELKRLDIEREGARFGGRSESEVLAEAIKQWESEQAARKLADERLNEDLHAWKKSAEDARQAVEKWRPKLMTRTISGFLVWIGYASVPATGTLLALLLNGKQKVDTALVVNLLHTYVSTMSSVWSRFAVLLLLVVGSLAMIAGVAVLCDKLVGKLDEKWRKATEERPEIRLNPTIISRRTYLRLLASLPFLFAAGLVAAFIAAVPGPSGGESLLALLIPTLKYTFIGSAIALMATAIFCLYIIKVIDRPEDESHRRRAWEIMAAASLLVISVIASIPMTADRTQPWLTFERAALGGWALFMLAGSLTFAYGLIFHGLFKDIDKIEERIDDIDQEIRRNSQPPTLLTLQHQWPPLQRAIRRAYLLKRIWLEELARRVRVAHLFGLKAEVVREPSRMDTILGIFRRKLKVTAPESDDFFPLEREVAPDVVADLRKQRDELARLDAEIAAAAAVVAATRSRTSFEAMDELENRRAALRAAINASLPGDEAVKARSYIDQEELQLRIEAAIVAAKSLRPTFEPVRQSAIKSATARGVRLAPSLRPQRGNQ